MTLSEKIERDLADRLKAGRQPCRLTLKELAAYYGVSPMPVREAVRALVKQGLVVRGANKRLVASRPQRISSSPAQHPSQESSGVDVAVADFIIARSLLGEASFLREEAMASRFGVGRTVIRRVLGRLAGERLIKHVPRRGWRIRPYSEQDMLDYLDVREALELRALDLARPRLLEADLERLLKANSPDRYGRPRLDNSLHQYWIERSGNRYIQDFFAQHGIYFQALFDRAAYEPAAVAKRAIEHSAILQALLDQDWALARLELSRHIRVQRPNVTRMFEGLTSQRARSD